MVEKKEKVLKGLIKAVYSGDYLTITKTTKAQGPTDHNIYLASV